MSNSCNKYQLYYMVASVPHLAKHCWNAERKDVEWGSCPIPLTHIAQSIPHQGHANTSPDCVQFLNRQHKSH